MEITLNAMRTSKIRIIHVELFANACTERRISSARNAMLSGLTKWRLEKTHLANVTTPDEHLL
jgi:hypothetical protein